MKFPVGSRADVDLKSITTATPPDSLCRPRSTILNTCDLPPAAPPSLTESSSSSDRHQRNSRGPSVRPSVRDASHLRALPRQTDGLIIVCLLFLELGRASACDVPCATRPADDASLGIVRAANARGVRGGLEGGSVVVLRRRPRRRGR